MHNFNPNLRENKQSLAMDNMVKHQRKSSYNPQTMEEAKGYQNNGIITAGGIFGSGGMDSHNLIAD